MQGGMNKPSCLNVLGFSMAFNLSAFLTALFLLTLFSAPSDSYAAEWKDVSSNFTIEMSNPLRSRRSPDATVTTNITYSSVNSISGPFRLVLSQLAPDSVSLKEASGYTSGGYPYVDLTPYVGESFDINESTGNITLTILGGGPVIFNFSPAIEQQGNTIQDADSDGVSDELDQCSNSPVNEAVDADGCALSQLDSDSDGVADAFDYCSDTPIGESVDISGCSITSDSDGDGVSDELDFCPESALGETVDSNGCVKGDSDEDGDGISDINDQCLGTSEGQAVDMIGCSLHQLDSDGDGVSNAEDKCRSTPPNEPIVTEGCSVSQVDSDGDGINDALDVCANTPENTAVTGDGCAFSKLDSDSDSVVDSDDQCPNTPEGETVNTVGCSLSQLDGDDDGVNDLIDQCPNTYYVDAVNSNGCSKHELDSDKDGVPDYKDLCESTPTDDPVNSNGCSLSELDSDSDQVSDALDQCDDTPAGETPNEVGCSATQLDDDGDGVSNALDRCAASAVDSEVDIVGCPPIYVQITSPETLLTIGYSPIVVSGTISDPQAILTINGQETTHQNGQFSTSVSLQEGLNNIVARATNSATETTDSIVVSMDMTPPYVTVDSPKDGSVVFSNTVSVTGLVNDIVRGTISGDEVNVTVNGIVASVANRSYQAIDVPLIEGDNIIEVVAADQMNNIGKKTIRVSYRQPSSKQIELVSGNQQQAEIYSELSEPLVVRLLNNGEPVEGVKVVFRVVQGDGILAAGTASEAQAYLATTNGNGIASTVFRLGGRAGIASHKIAAKAVGYDGEALFNISAVTKPGNKISVISGNNQRGVVGQPLSQPLIVAVTDSGSNLVPNADVEFVTLSGGGKFSNNASSIQLKTDGEGRASVEYILGDESGLDAQRVVAKLQGSAATASFSASGLIPGDPSQTTIKGIVLDNQDRPIPGVTVRVEGSNRNGIADEQGQFVISEVPVGPVHLLADGSTATVEGEWPTLSYNLVTIAGTENPLPAPIYMVKLDMDSAVTVGEEDVIYTLPEMPGFKLTVKAGSVTFPNGSKTGQISVTAVNANKIPMAPPNGMQPQVIVTIQPAGAMFDPPAPLTLPNVDGHAPGAQVEMYSYDHDLEEFVTIGLGTVSKDGLLIESNPGVGVIKAGWHCGSQPSSSGCCGGGGGSSPCGHCFDTSSNCEDSQCIYVPKRSLPDQSPNDCKTWLCDGTFSPTDETANLEECKQCDGAGNIENAPDNTDCEDGMYCTSKSGNEPGPDECKNGKCTGKKVEDIPIVGAEDKVNIGKLVDYIRGGVAALQYAPGCDFDTSFSVSVATESYKECCESKDAVLEAFKVSGSVGVSGGTDCYWTAPLPIAAGTIRLGITVGGSVSGAFSGSGHDSDCEENCGWSVSGGGKVTAQGGIAGIVLSQDVLLVTGVIQGNGKYDGKLDCQGLSGGGCFGPVMGVGTVTFGGLFSQEFSFPIYDGQICF